MKSVVNVFSASAVLLLGLLCLLPLDCLADSNSGHSGKMESITQDEAERQNQIFKDNPGTQLEKMAPDLFKDQTVAAIKAKQAEEKKTAEKLFTAPHQPDSEFRDMEKMLFSKDYKVSNSAVSYKTNNGGVKNLLVLTASGVLIAAACAGIYIVLKKWFGVKERR
jgi:type VII secretion protein EssA